MKSWQLAVGGLACLVVAGCRADPNVALLERELRLQEDEIYRMRGVVEDYQAALRSCRDEDAAAGRSGPADPGPGALLEMIQPRDLPSASEETDPSRDDATYGDPRSEAPPSPYGEPSSAPPDGDQPDGPSGLQLQLPDPPDDQPPDDGAAVRPIGWAEPIRTEPILPADSGQVAHLTLNRLLTGGYEFDGRPGDDGIVVVIQTRDGRGRSVEAPADVSVAVLDPAFEGEAARVARWDFTAAEIAGRFRRTASGRAIQLEMAWPDDPPVNGGLYLFVRYTTRDGRRLQAQGPIQVALPGETSKRWVAAEPPSDSSLRDEDDRVGPRQDGPAPAIRMPASASPAPADVSSGQKTDPPVWSPNRP